MALNGPVLVLALEVVGAEVFVFDAIAKDKVGGLKDVGGDGDDGLLSATAGFDPQEFGPQVAVLDLDGGPGGLDEDRLQSGGAFADAVPLPFAGALVHLGAEPRPRDEGSHAGEAIHGPADLAEDHLGDGGAHTVDGGEARFLLSQGLEELAQASFDALHLLLGGLDGPEVEGQQEAMVLGDAAPKRLDQFRLLSLEAALGEIGQPFRVRLTFDEGLQER